ncbi:MAG: hypothetical protein JWN44_3194 [Myxococcales bacterium]|nr:hypothetical protein [Myxococcales bacterium]
MTRTLRGGLFVAALLIPATSFATPVRDPTAADRATSPSQTPTFDNAVERSRPTLKPNTFPSNPGASSLGSGMVGGNQPGDVTGPGSTPIDTSVRGPLNDVQPGAPGSSDTMQAAHPKPQR